MTNGGSIRDRAIVARSAAARLLMSHGMLAAPLLTRLDDLVRSLTRNSEEDVVARAMELINQEDAR